ncbi:helix-turn-helix domain-containing protein [Streptomyces sp. HUAS TT7]|uniref:helix-turn-helix domain-containing protein n=1 Tax=Streptomyces sp. HUAS TT7 TaxID=3447507 RepID=UPI003F66056F
MAKKIKDKDSALFGAITRGKKHPKSDDVGGMLSTLKGAGLSLKAIAKRMGKGESTVRNWFSGKSKPKPENLKKIQETVTKAPEVRQQSLSPLREQRMRNQGSYFRMSAKIGSKSPGSGFNGRERTIGGDADKPIYLEPDQISAILDAYNNGDDAAAMQALEDALGDQYYGGIRFEDVTSMEFIRDYGGERPEM